MLLRHSASASAPRKHTLASHHALGAGANTGGKSTLLRAACIAVILAQMGCYVPCVSARLSPVESIFTRMGTEGTLGPDRPQPGLQGWGPTAGPTAGQSNCLQFRGRTPLNTQTQAMSLTHAPPPPARAPGRCPGPHSGG
jgi:hypothetical protein